MDSANSQGYINAQDMDSVEIVVSSIRPGMKREFAMMMKAQSEIGGLTAGRRRVTRSQYAGSSSKGPVPSDGKSNKKVKQLGSGEQKKDEAEKLGGEGTGELKAVDTLDEDKSAKRDAISERPSFADDLGNVAAEAVAIDRSELVKVRDDSSGGAVQPICAESLVQPLCTESLLPQVGGSDGEVTQERSMMLDGVELSQESGSAGTSSTTSPSKLEMKMSKKVVLRRIPMRLKDLLETGLLEGLHVRYRGSKGKKRQGSVLNGIIQGTGILCSCEECKGSKVVSPNQFELHARSGNKRPPEYIILDNGNSLRDVLNACKVHPSDSLQLVIQTAIGRTDYTKAFCLNCKGLIPKGGAGRPMLLCDSCIPPKEPDSGHTQIIDPAPRSPLADSSSPIPSSSQPAVPESDETSSSCQHKYKRQGKITMKDLKTHKYVFAEEVLPDGAALSYVLHGKVMLEGFKKGSGIFCMCCRTVISPSLFEAHAGYDSRRKPYISIYISNGLSLHELAIQLAKQRESNPAESDDLCFTCADGGDLLCCDNCPRTFHLECVGLSSVPEEKWYCKYCRNMFEKENVRRNANAIAAGRVPGVDAIAEINQRCIRIIEKFEADDGGCAVCRGHDFSDTFNGRTVMVCEQCEKEYHVDCLREKNIADLKELPEDDWFCCGRCSNLYSALQKLVDNGEQRLPDSILAILKRKSEAQSSQQNPELDIKWRLLLGKKASEETRVWLSGAVNLFHDQFDPIADANTNMVDLIPAMVYGRSNKHYSFFGMYCVALMVNSVVVTAGVLRIFSEEVAELPLVATAGDCQGKGYFQALFACIEDVLLSLNVKVLVLPAAHDAEAMWKNKFGFEKLKRHQLERYRSSYKLMIFQGTTVLHKRISRVRGMEAS